MPRARKSVYLRVRITQAERARLNRERRGLAEESLSDAVRRILFTPLDEDRLDWLLDLWAQSNTPEQRAGYRADIAKLIRQAVK